MLLTERKCNRRGFKGLCEQYFNQIKVQNQFIQLSELHSLLQQTLLRQKKKNRPNGETKYSLSEYHCKYYKSSRGLLEFGNQECNKSTKTTAVIRTAEIH